MAYMIEMSSLLCSICGAKNLFFIKSQEDIAGLSCMECKCGIIEIELQEVIEFNIENFQKEQY